MVFLERRGRDRLHIIAEILEIARNGTLKTQVMYRANLSFSQLSEYLEFMLRTSLLARLKLNGKEVYKATEKGLDFLQRYRGVTELMECESDKLAGKEEGLGIQIKTKAKHV